MVLKSSWNPVNGVAEVDFSGLIYLILMKHILQCA